MIVQITELVNHHPIFNSEYVNVTKNILVSIVRFNQKKIIQSSSTSSISSLFFKFLLIFYLTKFAFKFVL